MKYLVVFALTLLANITHQALEFTNRSPYKNLIKREFSLFTVWLSCEERLPVLFNYQIDAAMKEFNRSSYFRFDPSVNRTCQQKSSAAYSLDSTDELYDRGHMVAANHMSSNEQAIKESNYMTNIAPQTHILNRQAWYVTEEIIQCLKVVEDLDVIGGVIMGDNKTNDHFLDSHGVRTPDYYWKIIHKLKSGDVIAWIMPNDFTATRNNVDNYLTTIGDIEKRAGFTFVRKFTKVQKRLKHETSWDIPKGCQRSG